MLFVVTSKAVIIGGAKGISWRDPVSFLAEASPSQVTWYIAARVVDLSQASVFTASSIGCGLTLTMSGLFIDADEWQSNLRDLAQKKQHLQQLGYALNQPPFASLFSGMWNCSLMI